jgi:hypothetical protein
MLSFQRIRVLVVFVDTSRPIAQQAAWLARCFHAEIVLLLVTPLNYPAGLLKKHMRSPRG